MGLETSSIKTFGRWKSDAFKFYVRPNYLFWIILGDRRVVWIIGHSFIFWTQRRASSRIYSEFLDLDPNLFSICWHGKRGMVWGEFLTELGSMAYSYPLPNILIIHLGGNDIGCQNTFNLIFQMKHYLTARLWFSLKSFRDWNGWNLMFSARLKQYEGGLIEF